MTKYPKNIIGAGSVTKHEKLINVNSKLSNTSVLELEEPFPGYYHHIPHSKSINSIFLLVKSSFYPETILRATNLVNKSLGFAIHAAYSRLSFGLNKDTYVAIRLVNINNYDDIKTIQQAYLDAGIEFEPELKLNISKPVIINVNKVFSLHLIEEGIYGNESMPEMKYVSINKGGNWDWFEAITNKVKNNFHRRNFDIAHAVVFEKGGLKEMVRIFDEKITNSELLELQNLFNRYV